MLEKKRNRTLMRKVVNYHSFRWRIADKANKNPLPNLITVEVQVKVKLSLFITKEYPKALLLLGQKVFYITDF